MSRPAWGDEIPQGGWCKNHVSPLFQLHPLTMKSRHQIKFKPMPTSKLRCRPEPKAHLKHGAGDDKTSSNVTSSSIQICERRLNRVRALSDRRRKNSAHSLTVLCDWLSINGSSLDAEQMNRLCKALFNCFWMKDQCPFNTAAIEKIVSLGDVKGP